jgi:hypothetical protein
MKRIIPVVALATATAAIASEYHTVTWFADHPAELHATLRLCRDNAGLTAHNPNCINAEEAGTIVVQRELEARNGGIEDPTSPGYWRARPKERQWQQWICNSIDKQHAIPDPTTASMCSAVRAAGG